MEQQDGFIYGVLGGTFVVVLELFRLRQTESLPKYLKQPFYWAITLAMVLIGGVLVVVYLNSGFLLNPLLAIHVGAAAPLILGTLASTAPSLPGKVS